MVKVLSVEQLLVRIWVRGMARAFVEDIDIRCGAIIYVVPSRGFLLWLLTSLLIFPSLNAYFIFVPPLNRCSNVLIGIKHMYLC